tara:strand:- start:2148 stop:4955 length:2808 start_codon:yes stop_codon:yes gene_type:complete
MKMTMEFVGEDKVSKVTSAVGKNLRKVTKEQQKSAGILTESKQQWALFAAGMNGALGVAGALLGAVGKIGDAVQSGAKAMGIEAAFRRAIPGADALLAKMEQASQFTIDETSLMRFGAKMKRAGIDVEKIPQIMELATKAAVATGTEIDQAVQSITDSFIKQNDRGFKSLDINLELGRHFDNHAVRLGKSTTQLTKAEKITIMLTEAARELGVVYGDISLSDSIQIQMTQMQKTWEDFKSDTEVWFATRMGTAVTNIGNFSDAVAATGGYAWDLVLAMDPYLDATTQNADQAEREAEARERAAAAVMAGPVAAPVEAQAAAQLNAEIAQYLNMQAERLPIEQQLEILRKKKAAEQAELVAKSKEETKAIRDKNQETIKAINSEGMHLDRLGMNIEASKRMLKVYKTLIGQSEEYNGWVKRTGGSWSAATIALKEHNKQTQEHTKNRIRELAALAKVGDLMPQQVTELKKLEKTMASYGVSVLSVVGSSETMATLQGAMIDSAERQAIANASNAAELAKVAIAQGNYTTAARAADTAWREGTAAGEDYRVKNEEIRAALIESTKAQLQNARAIYETMEAEAALGAMERGGFGRSLDIARGRLAELQKLSDKLDKIGTGKAARKPRGRKPKSALIDLAKEEADAIAEIREGIFIREETERGVDRMRELWSPPSWMKGADEIRVYAEEQARAIAEGLNLTWDQVGSAMLAESDALTDGYIENLDRRRDAMAAFAADVQASQQESFSNAISFAGQFGNHWSAAMGQSLGVMEHQYQKWQVMQKAISSGAISQGEAYAKAAPGMIAAGGQVAGAFIQDEQAKAAVLAAMEAAASVVAFAPPVVDVVGGTMHALAASMYTAIAAGAFKGSSTRGGGGGAARKPPAAIAPRAPDQDTGSTNQITLNFSGTVVGSDDSAGRALAALLRREMKWQAPIESSGAM